MPQVKTILKRDSQESLGVSASDDPMEKDKTEIELEKLLFGDNTGFHEELKAHGKSAGALFPYTAEQDQQDEHDEGLEGVDDADVCTFDDPVLIYISRLTLCSALLPGLKTICS